MLQVKQKGFTLVEIAIVLVIVGLLIGGVLKGQEMITNAKLKRIESDNAGIAAAMFSYQDRYLLLPGDDNSAQGRFDVYSATAEANVNGSGGGTVDGDWNTADVPDLSKAATAEETEKFFGHLRAANLIPGGGGLVTTRPSNAYGGQIGIQDSPLKMAGHTVIFGQIEGEIAQILESRLDDRAPDTGRIQSNEAAASMDELAGGDDHPLKGEDYSNDNRYDMAFRL